MASPPSTFSLVQTFTMACPNSGAQSSDLSRAHLVVVFFVSSFLFVSGDGIQRQHFGSKLRAEKYMYLGVLLIG